MKTLHLGIIIFSLSVSPHGTQIDSVKYYPPFEPHSKDSTKPLCIKPETYDKLASQGYFLH